MTTRVADQSLHVEKGWRRLVKNLAALAGGIALVAVVLSLAEIAFGHLSRHPGPHAELRQEGFFVDDEQMGYRLHPNARTQCCGFWDEQELFSKIYSVDRCGRRLTPVRDNAARPYFAVFFGCSFTMGEGCSDNETLPFYLGEFAKPYRPYNYGVRGYGPQHMLYRLQHQPLAPELTESQGICIYVWITDHINRAIGAMPGFNYRVRTFPCYVLDDGGLSWRGNFDEARPWRSALYDLMWKSNTMRYFNVNLPFQWQQADFELAAAILSESANAFKRQFPESEFCVLFYYPAIDERNETLMKLLDEAGIKYVPPLISREEHQDLKYPDGHPTPAENKLVAQRLAEKLRLTHTQD